MSLMDAITGKPDTSEILKAQQKAEELGIYKIIHNITCAGENTLDFKQGEWESCILKYKSPEPSKLKNSDASSIFSMTNALMNDTNPYAASISMPDGTLLYRSEGRTADSQTVTDFRVGKWIERITAYSNELTAKRKQEEEDRINQINQEKLKPFNDIDF